MGHYKSFPERGGLGFARFAQAATIVAKTLSIFLRTSIAGNRIVKNSAFATQSSRAISRSGRSPRLCVSPSTSIASLALTQAKSSANGPIGCCFRNRQPPGCCCNCTHKRTSGNVISLRIRRAIRIVRSGAPSVVCFFGMEALTRKSSPERGGARSSGRRGRYPRIPTLKSYPALHPPPPSLRATSPFRGGF